MQQFGNQDESVRHLAELGYTDPVEVAAREEKLRQQSAAALAGAEDLYRAGREQDAMALLQKLAADDPDWISPHHQLAAIHYRAGRCNEAQAELDWLALHGVEHPRLALMAGGVALARREMACALENLEYATYVEPDIPSGFYLLGLTLLRLGRLDDAEKAFQRALEKNPFDGPSYDGCAAICLRKGEYEAAAEHALSALEHDMQWFGAHYHLGVALHLMERPEEAITAMEIAAKLEPARAAPYFWLSRIARTQLGDADRSIAYRNRAKEIVRRRKESRRNPLP